MLDVSHNPEKLPVRKTLKVHSGSEAYRLVQLLMAEKRPRGMRIRYVNDNHKRLMHLSARHYWPVMIVERFLRDRGAVRP